MSPLSLPTFSSSTYSPLSNYLYNKNNNTRKKSSREEEKTKKGRKKLKKWIDGRGMLQNRTILTVETATGGIWFAQSKNGSNNAKTVLLLFCHLHPTEWHQAPQLNQLFSLSLIFFPHSLHFFFTTTILLFHQWFCIIPLPSKYLLNHLLSSNRFFSASGLPVNNFFLSSNHIFTQH